MAAWEFKILVDGDCPLCRREGALMRRLDAGRGRLVVEDITAPEFDPARYGLTMTELMGQIHGITQWGEVVRGMEAFRRAYRALGLGWVLAPTAWPGVRQVSDRAYRWFARNRHRLTGRASACTTDRCTPRT